MSTRLKIAVAEPSLILRSGLISVLKRLTTLEIEIVEIGDLTQLTSLLSWQKPDMLIVNPAWPGALSLQQFRQEVGCRQLRCIALQNSLADATALKAFDSVISVYDTAEQIKEKLLALTQPADRPEQKPEPLSAREKEIVIGVVKGLTNKQIADRLFLSTHTVITHRRNIAAKLQIHSPAGLTIYAIVNKLVELDDIKDTIHTPSE